ncbi:MAG TPA: methyltransferase domain-containing protein [Polyangiales bacterium]|nr:methyltransferase domain-containing protein [Polyangiales bacterium]
MTSSVSSNAHADLALAVYLEPNIEGRRVLLLGDAQGILADRLDRLASQLEIIDPSTREPSHGEIPELPFDDFTFDVVLVCDVSVLPQPVGGAIRELRRVLARDGILVAASFEARGVAREQSAAPGRRRRRGPSPQSSLENLLGAEFPHVRVLAQAPIAGYALGERDTQDEFAIDSSLVSGQRREPDRLVGVASDVQLPLEARLWVEVPVEPSAPSAPSGQLIEELRRAEDEAREALHRESDLLRELETERRARQEAESVGERARSYERKLLAAEADYDDAVARVRYFEGAIGEHEASTRHERERRENAERELNALKKELSHARSSTQRDESERADARAELETATQEIDQLEQRLVGLGKQLIELEQDKREHEQTARDLLEELRRLESESTAAVEHDARVTELEAERDRAVERALDAEVAREAAQMRSDELRAELETQHARRTIESQDEAGRTLRHELGGVSAELKRTNAELARLRGENSGLSLRLNEAENALSASRTSGAPDQGRGSYQQPSDELARQLSAADQRLSELTRELEEADRFAELHAEDAERLSDIEAELESARDKVDDLRQELRASDDELHTVRAQLRTQADELERAQNVLGESSRRDAERDDALAALADARAILAQLAGGVGADENDHTSIVQAVLAKSSDMSEREAAIDALRGDLSRRDARIAQLERWLNDAQGSVPQDNPEH